jgi:UDP-glucose 4-epimerase
MAKALVTGGAGFIGSHLCDRLVREGHDVVVLDDFSLGRRENLAHLGGSVEILEGSVLDVARFADALEGVTRVYHLAALISGYDSLTEAEAYTQTNIVGLYRLLETCGRLPGVRFVFASSSTVYGARDASSCREDDPPAPLTMYALSKLAGEHMLRMYAPLHGFEHVSLRLFNVYGPRQNPDHPYANVTCKFARAAAEGSPVTLYGDGKQTRDFVFVDDVVEAFMRASVGAPRAVYNVGTGQDAAIIDLLETVQGIAGARLEVDRRPPWPNDIRRIRADISAMREDLGFAPEVSLRDGLERTVAFFRSRAR